MSIFSGVNNPGLDFNQLTAEEADLVAGLAALGDPGANRILGWDDTDNAYVHMVIGSGLSYDAGTNTLSASSGVISFGADNQIPYTNGTTDDFDYTSGFTFDGTDFASPGDVTVGVELNMPSGGVIRWASNASFIYSDAASGGLVFSADNDAGLGSSNHIFAVDGTNVFQINGTEIRPQTNNQIALGASGTAWADLFLASGAVINFNAGDVTLTHGSSVLTLAGGVLAVPDAGITINSLPFAASDAGADAIYGWDDTAGQYENLTQAEVLAVIGNAAADGSTKGVAGFDSTDFSASSGIISLQTERIQDIAGAMVTGNTETGITVTYQDADGTIDFEVTSASDSTPGIVELAVASEVTTGTDTTRAITPDALAGSSIFGVKAVSIQVTAGDADVATGDGQAYITIPAALNGMNLIRAQATVVTAGTTNATTVMIHNLTDTSDMLSGAISIASGGTVGTVGTIDATKDDVATNDVIRIDVDSVSTTAPKGLMVVLEFQLP